MFEWSPNWAIAAGAVILAILVGMWAHRVSLIDPDPGNTAVGCQHALINLC